MLVPGREILQRAARSRRWALLVYLPTFLFLLYFFGPTTYDTTLRIIHTSPFSYERQVENYDFHPTETELNCLAGTLPLNASTPNPTKLEPIPKTVHFIWGLKEGKGSHARFGFIEYLSIRSAIVSLQPTKTIIHHAALDKSSPWFRKLEKHLTLVHYDPATDPILSKTASWQAAHKADLLRLDILKREGGIYLDLDVLSLRPFDALLSGTRDVVMGHEGGNRAGMANAIIVARPNSAFINRWIDTYSTFSPSSEWNYHSVTLPKQMAKDHPDEICALPPTAFFWPTWTWRHVRYMHEKLDKETARGVEKEIERLKGALVEGQLAYHAWSQMAWGKYLSGLTPDTIRAEDTRFNILMRRFLED